VKPPNEITRELYQQLKGALQGEVRFDDLHRQLYSTNASAYSIVPTGVVIPRHAEDVLAAIELLDHIIIQRARAHPAFRPRLERFAQGSPQALLVVEFSGDQIEGLAAQAAELEQRFYRQGCRGPVVHCTLPEVIENVWSVRHEVNGLIQKSHSHHLSLLEMLRLLPGALVEEIPSGCCGMAGSFGYEKEHYQLSLACGEERLVPAVRAAPLEAVIAASGVSCRQQILHGTGRQAVHPVQILAEALVL
jgi:hypothetical protein